MTGRPPAKQKNKYSSSKWNGSFVRSKDLAKEYYNVTLSSFRYVHYYNAPQHRDFSSNDLCIFPGLIKPSYKHPEGIPFLHPYPLAIQWWSREPRRPKQYWLVWTWQPEVLYGEKHGAAKLPLCLIKLYSHVFSISEPERGKQPASRPWRKIPIPIGQTNMWTPEPMPKTGWILAIARNQNLIFQSVS